MDDPDPEPAPRSEKVIEPPKVVEAVKAPQPPPAPVPPPLPEGEPVPDSPNPNRNTALLRLKKRSRAVVILASAGHGELLREHLQDEGYGRVLAAVGWDEVVAHLHEPGVGLFLIDTERPVLESLEMVQRLHEAGLELPAIVLAAEEVSRTLVLAAHRAGVSQLLVKPYALDEAFSLLLEQQMGLG